MISLAVNLFLWGAVVVLAIIAGSRSKLMLRDGARAGVWEFVRVLPRLAVGIIGSGFIAAAVPQDIIGRWLGPDSGILALIIVTIAGALTPGGPVVGFALGAAALKGGAGAPQVIAYSTAWALFAFPRLIVWELPMMPPRVVWLRVLVSLPIPLLAAAGAMLLGKP
jgi:uncharacterized membrane protein YraQ (UPF0718 family)